MLRSLYISLSLTSLSFQSLKSSSRFATLVFLKLKPYPTHLSLAIYMTLSLPLKLQGLPHSAVRFLQQLSLRFIF